MEKIIIDSVENLIVTQVSSGGKVRRYEIEPKSGYGFFRKSENVLETGLVVFPASWGIENILADITVQEI